MSKVSIIGAGSWGVSLAVLLSSNGHEVCIWSLFQEEIDLLIKHREHGQLLE